MKAKLLLLVGMSGILLGAQLSEAEDLSPVDLGRWLCELTSSSSPEQLLGQFPGSGLSTPRETTERDSGTTTHTWTMTSDGFEVEYEYETERRRRQRHRHLLHIDPKVRYPRGDHIIFGSYEEADQWLAYLGQPTEGRFGTREVAGACHGSSKYDCFFVVEIDVEDARVEVWWETDPEIIQDLGAPQRGFCNFR